LLGFSGLSYTQNNLNKKNREQKEEKKL